jgi:transaldolase
MTEQLDVLRENHVSIWLDDLNRRALTDGTLRRRLLSSALAGVTTNPTIFARAISTGAEYREVIAELRSQRVGPAEALRALTSQDVRAAADVLRPIYDSTAARDGFVSIEVDPALAYDARGTVAAARLLHWLVDRPNVMVKIPATRECLPAITTCLAEGISVNVTLIFSPTRYAEVLDAARDGMLQAADRGGDLSRLRSVASFFVSRIDSAVDPVLRDLSQGPIALEGAVAVSSALVAYGIYRARATTRQWRDITAAGGLVQRPLWASTGTKDARYPDTMYVDRLVTPDAISTMPVATLDAFLDHGRPEPTTPSDIEEAENVLCAAHAAGVDLEHVWRELEDDGVTQFQKSWHSLTQVVADHLGLPESCTTTSRLEG